ncbi:hypothetical protein COW36_18645 [bacterium (Candidatus Blackallbacteria) CG17_big_fil_post_rev_8_21_14_2_50_48_46]|uniref:Uncharacterized protein n=1 Tax=bacterium (Candidatus Blackallbacteria) CG17_big_fil_post_rev_8_21_14_2_50_48_46 TaxID=2014261 RepID=A0A2M7G1F2_9BACT|nr:MAG: hypothetical protein COW64_00090 [bacterium (Candidatus Blackallbacteria) CG18_big_fil_WC_8_21_14_2_50_49_26]PIW15433.1 MAG: hypothetical protein COW36_18645 [bacterium (Candidatus Blackallbacteria) CG17_big_fil_post_rev_8_21_14_2_50_48_46]PIW49706.1 MAG: hypothetical protein COW20_04720 [bacterium (Candidatus Blackallbacteria) CG13_big_fil_rev_8_21_14_2_50_49_14]
MPFLKPTSQITWINPQESPKPSKASTAESHEQILKKADTFIQGSVATTQRIEEALANNSVETMLQPVTSQTLLLTGTTRLFCAGHSQLEALVKGEKTLSEATGAFSSEAVTSLLAGCALTLGKETSTLVLGRLGLPESAVMSIGLFAGLTSDQATQWIFERQGAKQQIETSVTGFARNILGH